ncbi:MAG: TrkH family potassium uptake protein [Lachnospiraceae bacterium]|nr:TrkH family potassium uptake protein [Lachnospiraceae bacterium]
MNYSVVKHIIGKIMELEGAFMLLPALVALIYREKQGLSFIYVAAGSALIGFIISRKKPENMNFYLKEGFVTVALSWIVMSVVGSLPFFINGDIPNYIDALFETVSGFTTTGASILSSVDALAKCSIFWRSFTHWIGGMGVIVFLLAVLPMAGGSNMNLMKAESPGPSVGKIVPKIKKTASITYLIYISMTVAEFLFLLIGKMPVFEAICNSMATAGTGGFAVNDAGFFTQTPYIQWVVTVFMILFGVNFYVYYLMTIKRFSDAAKHEEARTYLIIIFVAAGIIAWDIHSLFDTVGEAIRHSFFQVGSIITTTGFASADFNAWPVTSQTILVMLMFIGACAGSTGGGIKVSRFIILIKTFFKEITSYLHPRSVKKIKLEGKPVEHEVLRSTNVYIITFIVLFTGSMLLISLEGNDLITNFTAVAATINNIGPGLELVGPTANFGHFNVLSKLVFIFDMLAGRLELFPILLLFCPSIWIRRRSKREQHNMEA